MKFFIDNCLPPRIARALSHLDNDSEVVHLRDVMPADTPDVEWIRRIATDDSIAITEDKCIRKNPAERRAYEESGARLILVPKAFCKLQYWDQVRWVVNNWQNVKRHAKSCKPGHCYAISMNGIHLTEFA